MKIPVYQPDLSGNELQYVTDCITSNWISSIGSYIPKFEDGFASFCGSTHGIAVSNGTVALHLALAALDIGPGDEVIVPTLTFVATANAVRYTGATPVLVDSDVETWTLDISLIENKITSKTRAIIPVHLYGHSANMQPILDLASKYDLFVIEDAAEAHGAEYCGRRVGSMGHVGCFSFYGNKVITTGEGGMLVTSNQDLADRIRVLKDHGMSKERRYWHDEVGYNYRMTNIQAAIGVAQLERVNDIIQRKIEVAHLYRTGLEGCAAVICQPQAEWAKNIYWMYSILVTDTSALDRDQLILRLREYDIDSRPFFFPTHQLPPYKDNKGSYPVADDLARRGINLPSFPTLTNDSIEHICTVVRSLCEN